MYSEQNRAFSFAVLASIVLHGMALFGLSPRSPTIPAPEPQVPILARIAEPPAPAQIEIPPEVRPPPVAEPAKPRPRPKVESARKPMAKPVAPPAAQPPAVLEPPIAQEASPPAPPPVVARTDPAPPAQAAAPPAQPVETTPDPRSIAEYRMQIMGSARRYKHYPPVARENNWEGLVRLRMVYGANGRLASLSVTKTSGYDVLDKQAAEMFTNAAEAVPVPPLLRGKEFSLDVAAEYGLRD
jgi:protein TonB